MEAWDENDSNEYLGDDGLLDGEEVFDMDDGGLESLEPGHDANSQGGNHEDGKEDVEKKKVKKRIIQNPRVVLNFERLKSVNGIPALIETFKNFKFKGKHYEKEDLTSVMQNLQHWMCNHLYPGYDFETSMKILEKLGKKRVVQNYMKRLRDEFTETAPKDSIESQSNYSSVTENDIVCQPGADFAGQNMSEEGNECSELQFSENIDILDKCD